MTRKKFAGLDIVVENEAGSKREWHDRAAGKSGATTMRHDYGFIDGHVGSDGEEVDCYLGPHEDSPFVHVVHQLKSPEFKKHDEDKVFLGFRSEADAKAAYLAHRDDGEQAYGGMSVIPIDSFKAKLERRSGTGKIRHEAGTEGMIEMRIEQRGSEWVVLPESGDRVLGRHKTKADAEAQLRAIEASKARAHSLTFDASRGPDGKVRVHVWDRVCVPGHDEKDGEATDFDEFTLSQMVDNFVDRGDSIPIDHNHQSNYARLNGQPAPALGFYGALAVVMSGKIVKMGTARDVMATGGEPGLDLSRDGLWAYRCEVTEVGDELLPNFKYLSPTFTPYGVRRDGTEVGYSLAAVAATNTPWQSGTEITFQQTGAAGAQKEGATRMAKLAKLAKFVGLMEEGADDAAIKQALAKKMDDEAKSAMEDEAYDHAGAAQALEDMAKAYEDAKMEEEDDGEAPHVVMRRMAAKFRKLGKMEEAPHGEPDGDEEKSKMADDKAEGEKKEMARQFAQRLGISLGDNLSADQMFDAIKASAVPASQVPALVEQQVARALEARDAKRLREETAAKAAKLVDMAVAGGYPKDKERDLLKAASDPAMFSAIEASVAPYVRSAAASNPSLFEQTTFGGAPTGVATRSQSSSGPDRRVIENELATWVIEGERFSKMAIEMSESTDPATRAKIDEHLSENERSHSGLRLLAANRVLKKERPDLWDAAEKQHLFGL